MAVQGHLHRFKLTQALVYPLGNIFLAPLQIGSIAQQLFVLAAKCGLLRAQRVNLTLQIQQTAPQLGILFTEPAHFLCGPLLRQLHAIHALPHFENGAPGFAILKNCGMAGGQQGHGQHHCRQRLERVGQRNRAHQR